MNLNCSYCSQICIFLQRGEVFQAFTFYFVKVCYKHATMNSTGLFSTFSNAPDKFQKRAPTSQEMENSLIVFIADSFQEVMTSTIGVNPGVKGVLISKSKQMKLREIRPTLWHVTVTDTMLTTIHDTALLLLEMIRGQVQSHSQLQKEMALTRDVAMELQNKNRLLKGITGNFPGIIYQFFIKKDGSRGFSYASEGMDKLLDASIPTSQLFNAFVARVHPDDKEGLIKSISIASKLETSWQYEARYIKPDDTIIWLRGVASLTTLSDTQVYNGIIMDISEQIRLKETIVQSEKMMSIGGLAAGMAHEINNPLAGLLQNIQLLENRLDANHPINQRAAVKNNTTMDTLTGYMKDRNIEPIIDRMKEACRRMNTIVHDMLNFARSGGLEFKKRDICNLLDQTINIASADYDLKKKYDFRQIHIIRNYQKDIPPIGCIPSKLQQVFINILGNGAQAMTAVRQKSGMEFAPTFTINVTYDDVKQWITIRISDNGPGMSKAVESKIFEPFFTTKTIGEGTGLGLSVSYFIITREHSGDLTVESFQGKGSCFSIGLPRRE